VLERLAAIIAEPMPANLSPSDQTAYTEQTQWLLSVRDRVMTLGVSTGVVSPRDLSTGQSSGRVAQVATAREAQSAKADGRRVSAAGPTEDPTASLKAAVEAESRKFSTLSNASSARHQAAMNAIRNMKA
jgi:hypothetical protein